MVDGKVINTLSHSSSQVCNICKCTPVNMNNLEKVANFKCNNENLKYGLSPLHGWIKCLEYMLYISYKQGILMSNNRATLKKKK